MDAIPLLRRFRAIAEDPVDLSTLFQSSEAASSSHEHLSTDLPTMSEVSHVGGNHGEQDVVVPIMRQTRSEQSTRHDMQRRASSVPAVAIAAPRVLVRLSTEEAYEQCFNIQRPNVVTDTHAHQADALPVSPPRRGAARTPRRNRRLNSEEVVREYQAEEPSTASVPDTSPDPT